MINDELEKPDDVQTSASLDLTDANFTHFLRNNFFTLNQKQFTC